MNMSPLLVALLPTLITEAPVLVAQIIAVMHKNGEVTAQEVLDFCNSFPAGGGASFFGPKPAAPATPAP